MVRELAGYTKEDEVCLIEYDPTDDTASHAEPDPFATAHELVAMISGFLTEQGEPNPWDGGPVDPPMPMCEG